MNSNIIRDLIDWAEEENQGYFKEFILFINDVYEKKLKVDISYFDEYSNGKIKEWSIFYNRRFPDFDFDIQLDNDEYCTSLQYLTMKSFKKITNNKYEITDNEGKVFKIEG